MWAFATLSGRWERRSLSCTPDYRRMGLGKAAVLEGVRRCAKLGATVAHVGSDEEFYKALGFRKNHVQECWRKEY